jgi:hypothetical protein
VCAALLVPRIAHNHLPPPLIIHHALAHVLTLTPIPLVATRRVLAVALAFTLPTAFPVSASLPLLPLPAVALGALPLVALARVPFTLAFQLLELEFALPLPLPFTLAQLLRARLPLLLLLLGLALALLLLTDTRLFFLAQALLLFTAVRRLDDEQRLFLHRRQLASTRGVRVRALVRAGLARTPGGRRAVPLVALGWGRVDDTHA